MDHDRGALSREDLEREIAALKHALEQRRAEVEALRRSEEHYRSYFEGGLVGMGATGPDGRWIEANDALCAMFGYSREEILQRTWMELTYAEDVGEGRAHLRSIAAGAEDGFTAHKRYVHKDGHVIDAILRTRAVRRPDGSIDHVISCTQDISAQEQAMRELEQHIATIHAQGEAIRALSLPIIEVWEGTLAVPVVGSLDRDRAADMMSRLLERISVAGARVVVIDLTGVEAMDAESAAHLHRIVAATKLLGVRSFVTGIRPLVSQTMVASGIDLSGVSTKRSLKDALRLGIETPREDSPAPR